MDSTRLVYLRTVHTGFHARVIAARLGADGIATQIRGDASTLYPFGAVTLWVNEHDMDTAVQLLLADEVEAAFVPHPDDEEPVRSRRALILGLNRRQVLAAAGVVVMVWTAMASRLLT